MVIRELIFQDFLSFKGRNRLSFSASQDTPSLVLVLGPNNSGKTNIIRGLEFLLYGKLRREMPPDLDGLVNKAYLKTQRPTNGMFEGYVQATLEIAGHERTIRRRVDVTRTGNTVRSKVHLEEIIHDKNGDRFTQDEGHIQRSLERLVPPSLFDYFYFQGETLAQQLVTGDGNPAIRDGLSTLLHQDKWKEAIQTVTATQRKLSNEIQNLSDANREYQEKDKSLEQTRSFIREAQSELEAAEEAETKAVRDFNMAEEQIRLLGSGESVRDLTDHIKTARDDLNVTTTKFGKLNSEIAALVGDSKGMPFFHPAFVPALGMLEQMQRDNLLPADITDPFISRLLRGNKCICGRAIVPAEEFVTERQQIEEYRRRTMEVHINSGLLTLLNQLEKTTQENFSVRIKTLRSQTEKLLAQRGDTILREHELRQTIKDLEDQRARSNIEVIREQQAKQRDASDRRTEAARRKEAQVGKLRHLQIRETQLKRELADIGRRGAGPHLLRLEKIRERAVRLEEMIAQSLKHLKHSFYTVLQESVSRYYNPNVTDNSTAFVDPSTLLPSIRRGGDHVHTLGGGQRQMLVLAHIISLAELRRHLHSQLHDIGITLGKLDDQSFFLDSIFGPCDPAYAATVANFLPKRARQMMLLVARQQWYEEIRTAIEPHVQRVYGIRLHSNNQERRIEEYVFPLRDGQVNLFTRMSANEEPYSVIEELT